MWLVLCDPNDSSALWAGQGLRARGATPVEFVSPVELICAPRLEYRSENGGAAHATAELASGRRIDGRRLRGTLNRAMRMDPPQIQRTAPADRTYVRAEMDAILLAWLGALPAPLFNPAHPTGWAGAQWHPFAWALRAQKAGFRTPPQRCGYAGLEPSADGGHHTSAHLVFGGRTFPTLPSEMESAAVRLAHSACIPLLGIAITWLANGEAIFAGAIATPDLRIGGAAFLDALHAAIAPTWSC